MCRRPHIKKCLYLRPPLPERSLSGKGRPATYRGGVKEKSAKTGWRSSRLSDEAEAPVFRGGAWAAWAGAVCASPSKDRNAVSGGNVSLDDDLTGQRRDCGQHGRADNGTRGQNSRQFNDCRLCGFAHCSRPSVGAAGRTCAPRSTRRE